MPAGPTQTEKEISDNDIDNIDFNKELPFEAEYYRTSTDRDEFVRPIPNPEENEIDDSDDGIDLDDPSSFVNIPDCTYHIAIMLYYESIENLEIRLDGLTIQPNTKANVTLSEFVQRVQAQIFNNVKQKNLTNELVNDVISYLRQNFVNAFGYEDRCGVSTSVVTYYTRNDTASPQTGEKPTTDAPLPSANIPSPNIPDSPTPTLPEEPMPSAPDVGTPVDAVNDTPQEMDAKNTESIEHKVDDVSSEPESTDTELETEDQDDTTEEYQSKVLTRPKLSDIVQRTINAYKALNNWKYSK